MNNRNGFDEITNLLLGAMEDMSVMSRGYPVMDIYTKNENENKVVCYDIAMPGVSRQDVSVSLNKTKNVVIVENKHSEDSEERNYIRRSIAKRKFKTELHIPIGYKLDSEKSNFSESILHLELVPMDESENPIEKVNI